MNTIMITIGAVLLLAAAFLIIPKNLKRAGEFFANNALIVNITPKGRCTRLADASFTLRYLLCKAGSDASHIAICGATDLPLGVVPDSTPTVDQANSDLSYPLPVNILGLNEDTERMIASAAIAVDDRVVPATGGKVKTLPTVAGTYYVIGRAITAAAANLDQIEIAPHAPVKVIVAGTFTVTNANNAIAALTSSSTTTQAEFNALRDKAEIINDDLIALKAILDAAGITTT